MARARAQFPVLEEFIWLQSWLHELTLKAAPPQPIPHISRRAL